MRQIFRNHYIKVETFNFNKDWAAFIDKQNAERVLSLMDVQGDNYYCYIFCHALTGEEEFFLSFSSDHKQEELSLIHWPYSDLIVLETGRNIYLINTDFTVRATYPTLYPLLGMYVTANNTLLMLEDIALRIIEAQGNIIASDTFDVIEDFSIVNDLLTIQTGAGERKIIQL